MNKTNREWQDLILNSNYKKTGAATRTIRWLDRRKRKDDKKEWTPKIRPRWPAGGENPVIPGLSRHRATITENIELLVALAKNREALRRATGHRVEWTKTVGGIGGKESRDLSREVPEPKKSLWSEHTALLTTNRGVINKQTDNLWATWKKLVSPCTLVRSVAECSNVIGFRTYPSVPHTGSQLCPRWQHIRLKGGLQICAIIHRFRLRDNRKLIRTRIQKIPFRFR